MSASPHYDIKKRDDQTDRRNDDNCPTTRELEAQDTTTAKRRFSTYFTIVMSAFGLASVGCKPSLY